MDDALPLHSFAGDADDAEPGLRGASVQMR